MTPEQQLTLELTRIGVIGTLVGTGTGFLLGLLTTFLTRKWQRDDEIRKERRLIVEKRISTVEEFLSNLMEKATRVKIATDKFFISPTDNKIRYDEAYKDFQDCTSQLHVLVSLNTLRDKEFEERIKQLIMKTGLYVASFPASIIDPRNGEVYEKDKSLKIWEDFQFTDLYVAYGQMVSRIDDYKDEQLGLKRKRKSQLNIKSL